MSTIEREPTELVNDNNKTTQEESEHESDTESNHESTVSDTESEHSVLNYDYEAVAYIINVDGKPQGYCRSLDTARKCMWDIARQHCVHYLDLYYPMIEVGHNDDVLNVMGTYRWSLTIWPTPKFLHKIEIHKIWKFTRE